MLQKILHAISQEKLLQDTRGAVAVTVGILSIVLFGFAALALDISNAMIARNELQNVADASALVGARQLGVIYQQSLPPGTPYTGYQLSDTSPIVNAVTSVALSNQARQVAVSINTGDIVIGVWDSTTRTLTPGLVGPTGVQVTARRDGAANGPVATWLAGVLGIRSMNVVATATAALTGVGSTLPGDLETPFGISSYRFTTSYCNEPVRFFPTNDPMSCAGWHTWFDNPNARRLRQNIDAMLPEPPNSPATATGDELEFTNGNIANALNNLYNLYMDKRDPDTGIWTALVPVYEGSDCSAPNTALPITGYTTMKITNVQPPPNTQIIDGIVVCGYVDGGRGGGSSFGTLGALPGLVR